MRCHMCGALQQTAKSGELATHHPTHFFALLHIYFSTFQLCHMPQTFWFATSLHPPNECVEQQLTKCFIYSALLRYSPRFSSSSPASFLSELQVFVSFQKDIAICGQFYGLCFTGFSNKLTDRRWCCSMVAGMHFENWPTILFPLKIYVFKWIFSI